MYKRTLCFGGVFYDFEYEYDEGVKLIIRKVSPNTLNEEYWDEVCELLANADFADDLAYWRPLYEGEKQAGMLPESHYRD